LNDLPDNYSDLSTDSKFGANDGNGAFSLVLTDDDFEEDGAVDEGSDTFSPALNSDDDCATFEDEGDDDDGDDDDDDKVGLVNAR